MKVLYISSTLGPTNGYGTLHYNVSRSMQKTDPTLVADVFSGNNRSALFPGRNNLKSESFSRKSFSVPLLAVWDLLCILPKLRGKIDVIHVMVEHYAFLGYCLSKLLGAPYVLTVCGTYAVKLPTLSRFYRFAFENADSLVAISRYTRKRMQEIGIRKTIQVIGLGVDKSVFSKDEKVHRRNKVLFVGNLKARKGFDVLLDAMEQVNAADQGIQLVIIGKINLESEKAKTHIERIKSNNINVSFAGFASEKELMNHYRESKLNVLPSKSEPFFFEGFGLIHLEANACGTLTVGTKDSGNEDAIRDGYGFLIKYGDANALAGIIMKVCSLDPYPTLDIDGLPGWDGIAEEYLKVYTSISHSKSAR